VKVIYYCYGGTHSSVVTAAIHLKYLPEDRVPRADELMAVSRFDKAERHDIGVPYYMGTDELGNDIYVLGTGGAKNI
jgi:ABC-type dipeptide/oligopeptide/nickel transport system permease subunit